MKDQIDAELNRILERLGVRRECPEEALAMQASVIATAADLFAAVEQMRRDTLDALVPYLRPDALARLQAILAALDYARPDGLRRPEERAILTLQILSLVLSLLRPRR